MSLAHIDTTSRDITEAVPIDKAAILRAFNINPNDPKAQAMILACQKYGLDPLLKHAILISGNLYITRDGLLHIAHRDGRLDGIVIEDEGETDAEWWAKVTVHVKGQTHGYTYRGRYPKSGQQKKYGPEMAVKTAEVMALRRAFGVTGVPTVEEQWDIAPMVTGEQMARIEELLPAVPDSARSELGAWKVEQRISMKAGEFTADMADRVIAKLEELAVTEDGGGVGDGPSGSAAAAPPPDSSGGGGAADPAPPAATTPGDTQSGEGDSPPSSPAAPVEPGGVEQSPNGDPAEDTPAPARPSGPVTAHDLETALIRAIDEARSIPQAKAAVLRHAAVKHDHQGTFDDLVADEDLAVKVLAELGGTLLAAESDAPPADLTPWKERDEAAWDKWRRAANAKAGAGTKTNPHPRLLDEKPDYDLQRHALAFQASRRSRGEGNEVTSWSDLTEAECMRIWKPSAGTGALADIEAGRAVWGFTDAVVPEATGGWWLSQKTKEAAA